MLLQCWSQGTLDLVLQNTTYHQHGGVQDFSNFHRSKNLLHSTVLPALEPNWNPPFGIHQRREWLRMLASWWRSARPRSVDKAHNFGELQIFLFLKEYENLMLLEYLSLHSLQIFWTSNFTNQWSIKLKASFGCELFKHPLGFIIMTHPLTEKTTDPPPKKKKKHGGWHQELRQPPPPKPLPYSPQKIKRFLTETPRDFSSFFFSFDAESFSLPTCKQQRFRNTLPAFMRHSSMCQLSNSKINDRTWNERI